MIKANMIKMTIIIANKNCSILKTNMNNNNMSINNVINMISKIQTIINSSILNSMNNSMMINININKKKKLFIPLNRYNNIATIIA